MAKKESDSDKEPERTVQPITPIRTIKSITPKRTVGK